VSNLSTYIAGALAVAFLIDHAPIGTLRANFELFTLPDEVAEPAVTVNRTLKGNRWEPVHVQRGAPLVNAPLDVVDLPTGNIGKKPPAHLPGYPMGNVTAVIKREAPLREPQSGKRALPLGCESAFGRLVAPPLAHVLGRCII